MKIDIYTLLGMIKDGKAPKKIMFRGVEFEYESGLEDYFPIFNTDKFSHNGLFTYLFDEEVKRFLNDEVEILETTITYKKDEQNDKIEYLDDFYKDDRFGYSIDLEKVRDKINEIIDHLNNK